MSDPGKFTVGDARWRATDECVLWSRTLNNKGYGKLSYQGRIWYAHRLAYALNVGPIPSGAKVCHRCDTSACINPAHLFLGTQKDNLQDMARKGRHWQQQKTHCPKGHEYTPENTRYVRGTSRICIRCHRAWRPK